MAKFHCHETVHILVDFFFAQFMKRDLLVMKDILDLGYFAYEIKPLLGIELYKPVSLRFLGYDEVSFYLRILPPIKIFKITARKKLRIPRNLLMKFLSAENILFLKSMFI